MKDGHIMLRDGVIYADDVIAPPFTPTILDIAGNSRHKTKFYENTNNNVAVKIIENFLTVNGFDDLLQHKEQFSYLNLNDGVKYHATIMLHIIYGNRNPRT